MGSLFEQLLSGEDSEDVLGVSLVTQPPGIAPPMHVHAREAEAFYVLEGTLDYVAGEELHHLAAGSLIYLPKGVRPGVRFTGSIPARFLGLTVPGRLLQLYDEVRIPARERRLPGTDGQTFADEVAKWNDGAPRYG